MKKLMKKKMNVFGKSFSVFAIAMIAVIGLGAAALVPYLSNTVTGDVTVESPFEVKMIDGIQGTPNFGSLGTADTKTFADIYGGETIKATVGFKNQADASIDVIEKFVISAVDPNDMTGAQAFSCDDFEEIKWRTCIGTCNSWATEYQTMDSCSMSGNEIVIEVPNHYDSLEENVDGIELVLKENALGTYTVSAEVIPTDFPSS